MEIMPNEDPTSAPAANEPRAAQESEAADLAAATSVAADENVAEYATEAEAETQIADEIEIEAEAAPVEHAHEAVEVELRRSVRYGRIIISTVALGVVVGMVASLFFPVLEGANYELGQVVGLMAVVGGAIGLVVGALVSLLLGIIAGRKRGAAIAVQTDVR